MPESNTSYSEKAIEALKKHKGKIATGIAEGGLIKYINDARNVASNSLVDAGLKVGEVIKYPLKVEMLLTPHLVDVRGNTPMDPSYVKDAVVSGILNASKDPLVAGAVILSPIVLYGAYRGIKYVYDKKRK